ncbi:fumarylacetoacetate hydrolase family protein [Shewanella youngdeokensis]|uniref:Fumarylacetoacetate hydrolase family protein n=1 Tax=Shewanella youngdeokensis TaxID=2999068 RepID=A0ABZ0JVA7_9GAMM|nr:fumarylacetoacetate hydrolase family protein [Shewanella sp. DAU334]
MSNYVSFNGKQVCPSKIVCVGRNYVDHIIELGNEIPQSPVIFMKSNSAISSDIYTHPTDSIHYEGEISFIIVGKKIAGVGFGLDLTKRAIQSQLKQKGLPWERAKTFDRSAVFSQFVSIEDVSQISMQLHINGTLAQSSGCHCMINLPAALIADISSFMTLETHDVVMSGTPSGVGEVHSHDEFVGSIYDGEQLLVQQRWLVKDII